MPDLFIDKSNSPQPEPLETFSPSPVKEVKRMSALKSISAFILQPPITFETQEQDETIILLLRKHVITNVPWLLAGLFLFFLPLFFPVIGHIFNISSVPVRFQFIGMLLWYLFTFSFIFQKFLNWYYNVYIVTDHRVIDTDFFSLLYKHISDAPLDNIQDVSYSMGGVGSALFNYGNVYIQTAAEIPDFEFDAVPVPDRVVKTITKLMEDHGLHLLGKKP